MPSTVNGIGTTYYGKRNLQRHVGTCEHCHRAVNLESYETTLWFVVLFVPLIPLGKKQIIDQCPACTWHKAIPMNQWKAFHRQRAEAAQQDAEAAPNDAVAVIRYHAALVAAGKTAEADQLAREIEKKFGSTVGAQLYLGGWHEEQGRSDEAYACFDKALAIDPEDKDARRAVAVLSCRRGDPVRARQLLKFMEAPGPDQDLGVLRMLASAFQRRGEHKDALEIFKIMAAGQPSLARDAWFRRAVRLSERTQPGVGRTLPDVPFYLRRKVQVAAVAAVLFVIYAAATLASRAERALYVVNGHAGDVKVAVDNGATTLVRPGTSRTIRCGEGTHHALMTFADGRTEEADFTMRSNLLTAAFTSPVFILNPDGAAAIVWEDTFYSDKNTPKTYDPSKYQFFLHAGEAFLALPAADYTFEEFPKEITVQQKAGAINKTRVGLIKMSPIEVLGYLMDLPAEDRHPEDMLRYAEAQLRDKPDDKNMVLTYFAIAEGQEHMERCQAYLATRLADRPIRIDWHRMYQAACQNCQKDKELSAQYDKFLQAEPANAALMYLRGRICTRVSEAMKYIERGLAIDPKNAYLWLAKAFHARSAGDFASSCKAMQEACRAVPDDFEMHYMLFWDRFATRDYDALVVETRAALQNKPLSTEFNERLITLLAARGDMPAARSHVASYAALLAKERVMNMATLTLNSECMVLAMEGKFDDLIKKAEASKDGDNNTTAFRFNAYVGAGQLDRAAVMLEQTPGNHGLMSLLISLGWIEKGDKAKAAEWQGKAVQELARGDRDDKQAAAILAKATAPDMDLVRDVSIDLNSNFAMLLALADACPAQRKALLELTRKLTYLPPYMNPFFERVRKVIAAS